MPKNASFEGGGMSFLVFNDRISGSKRAVNLDYIQYIRDAVTRPLIKEGTDGVEKSVEAMTSYDLIREDLGDILSLTTWPGRKDPMSQVETKVVNEMDNYGLDILALSEVRWTGAGSQTLKKGSTILHSGTEKKKEAGVAIMLSKSASRALTKWTPINERIIVARFTGRQAKLTVVACYAPTNEADDTTKDNFYNTLQAVAKDIPSHDLVCFVGDFNAKVGSDKSYCPEVLGSQGLGDINENGILLVDFALANDLIIGGTQKPGLWSFDYNTSFCAEFSAASILDSQLLDSHSQLAQPDQGANKTKEPSVVFSVTLEQLLSFLFRISGSKRAVNLDYIQYIRDAVTRPLIKEGTDGVEKSVEAMTSYDLIREDLGDILSLTTWPGRKDPMSQVEAKVKSAFTRTFNKEGHLTPYADMKMSKVRGGGGFATEGLDEEGVCNLRRIGIVDSQLLDSHSQLTQPDQGADKTKEPSVVFSVTPEQ
ncbi:hypothetical protein QYM36_009588, partial [Artemia franciscana]